MILCKCADCNIARLAAARFADSIRELQLEHVLVALAAAYALNLHKATVIGVEKCGMTKLEVRDNFQEMFFDNARNELRYVEESYVAFQEKDKCPPQTQSHNPPTS